MEFQPKNLDGNSSGYPAELHRYLGGSAPERVSSIGNTDILNNTKVGLFCSSKCAGNVMMDTYHLAQRLRAEGRTVIGGFHSPMEREWLRTFLQSPYPVIICPVRGLGHLRIKPEWKRPLAERRLLILSPFPPEMKRGAARDGHRRNLFVAALADEVLIAHAAAGSKVVLLAEEIEGWGKPVRRLS